MNIIDVYTCSRCGKETVMIEHIGTADISICELCATRGLIEYIEKVKSINIKLAKTINRVFDIMQEINPSSNYEHLLTLTVRMLNAINDWKIAK